MCRLPSPLPTACTSTPSSFAGFHADLCQTFGILIKWCLATCLSFSGFWECQYINQRTSCIPWRDFYSRRVNHLALRKLTSNLGKISTGNKKKKCIYIPLKFCLLPEQKVWCRVRSFKYSLKGRCVLCSRIWEKRTTDMNNTETAQHQENYSFSVPCLLWPK